MIALSMRMEMVGDISLVPYLSDSYYQLLNDLVTTSLKNPQLISYPAGSIIIATACIESYINELIFMHSFSTNKEDNKKIKKRLYNFGTDILKKLKYLKQLANNPKIIDEDIIDDLRLLISLRGKIVHYTVEEEKPNNQNVLFKLQKLEKYLLKNRILQDSVSTERLLNPKTAVISKEIVFEVVKVLYKSGYEPPRPRWVTLIDPKRFG